MRTLKELNSLPGEKIEEELFKCCGSTNWSKKLLLKFPFNSIEDLKNESDRIWFSLEEIDWKEAFTHHPKIGDVESLKKKFASTAGWAEGEQSSVKEASEQVLLTLKKGNDNYVKKFGYIFIVCATGKSAKEMLSLLQTRLRNNPEEEIKIAMGEQNKITHLRLDKLFS